MSRLPGFLTRRFPVINQQYAELVCSDSCASSKYPRFITIFKSVPPFKIEYKTRLLSLTRLGRFAETYVEKYWSDSWLPKLFWDSQTSHSFQQDSFWWSLKPSHSLNPPFLQTCFRSASIKRQTRTATNYKGVQFFQFSSQISFLVICGNSFPMSPNRNLQRIEARRTPGNLMRSGYRIQSNSRS